MPAHENYMFWYSTGIRHGNLHQLYIKTSRMTYFMMTYFILGATQELVLAATNRGKTQRRFYKKNAGESTGRVEISKEEIPGSRHSIIIIIIIINPLTARVVWAPQMILQPVFSICPCSPLPFGTCRTPGLSIPWCCLPTSSAVCFVFFPLSLCLTRWFWSDLMNRKHDHTTAVCVSSRSSGGLLVVQLPAGSWHRHPRW